MLLWQPHPILADHYRAVVNGCSIVYGPLVRYHSDDGATSAYEVMDKEGETHHFTTAKKAEEFAREQ
jgi:hypothetical protein